MALGPPLNLPHMCLQVKQRAELKASLQRSKKKVKDLSLMYRETLKQALRDKEKPLPPYHQEVEFIGGGHNGGKEQRIALIPAVQLVQEELMEDPSQVEKLGVMRHLNSYKLGGYSRYSPAPQRSHCLASQAYQESFRSSFKKVSLEGTRHAN